MSKLRATMAISLDGFGAGPDQSVQDPLGKGGDVHHVNIGTGHKYNARGIGSHGGVPRIAAQIKALDLDLQTLLSGSTATKVEKND